MSFMSSITPSLTPAWGFTLTDSNSDSFHTIFPPICMSTKNREKSACVIVKSGFNDGDILLHLKKSDRMCHLKKLYFNNNKKLINVKQKVFLAFLREPLARWLTLEIE